jgi:hypothetical protein
MGAEEALTRRVTFEGMRRLGLLAFALVIPAAPFVAFAPAYAAGTICVGPVPAGTACSSPANTIQDAITASVNGDLIRVGPGSYTDGPYVLPPGVSLRGSGAGTGASATKLTLTTVGSQTYVSATNGTVADLRVDVSPGNGATGIDINNGTIDNVVVIGGSATTGVTGIEAQGSQVHDATVNVVGGTGNTSVESLGGNLLYSDSTWNGGTTGYRLVSGTDNISRVTVNSAGTAFSVEGGTLNIDDSVIDLGATGQTGLQAKPSGTADTATVNANFLTVVGGSGGSRGVAADANGAGTLHAVVSLTNSIVWGPTTSLVVSAGSGHTADFTVGRSDYQTASTPAPSDGGNNLDVDPGFVNPQLATSGAGDYHLRATSPLLDKASASAAPDRDGKARSFDGDRDGTAVPDMGAYELNDVTAPKTTIVSSPGANTNDNTPLFTFRSGPDATFQCQLDAGAFQPCSSPVTTTPLPDGAHTFTVRAIDPSFNVETAPPSVRFTVDTTAPQTTLTKKPQKRFYKAKVKFKFVANEAGARFQCQLDSLPWRSCSSPYRYSVQLGKHRLLVRAVDAAGNTDGSPARYKFKRIARPKPHRPHHHH